MEIWKNIFDSTYKISTYGRVMSSKRGIIMKQKIEVSKSGYRSYTISLRGNLNKTYTVSRLVAMHFIPNPDNLPNVLHNDDNPLNNRVDNLRWGTTKDNIGDRQSRNRQARGERQHLSKVSATDVYKIRELRESGLTIKEIAEIYNMSISAIYGIISGKTWSHLK